MSSVEIAHPDSDGLVGGVTIWPSHALPSAKYRFCENQVLSKAEFSLLYSRIGDAFAAGGEGADEFRLPPSEGLTFVGYDGSDTDFDEIGATGGTKAATMPLHNHTVTPNPHSHPAFTVVGLTLGATNAGVGLGSTATNTTSLTIGNAGGTGNNMPPHVVMRAIIKVL